jgi:uncharacterized membrane protein
MKNAKRRLLKTWFFAILVLAFQSAATVGFAASPEALSSLYDIISIDLPTPDGEFGFTSLADINDKAEIAGGFTNSTLGPYGFILDKKIRPTEVRCSKDVVSTAPQSINKHGEIAGFASVIIERISIPEPPFERRITATRGFFLDKRGRCTILNFPGARLTEATGVNDNGIVVGDYVDAAGQFHGFVWDSGLFLTFDVPFADASLTAPAGINNVGQIVGFYFDNNRTESLPNGHAHGFLYDNGVFTSFDFPHSTATIPFDINDEGRIVGIYGDENLVGHSFLFQDEQFATFEVPFAGVVFTDVSGLNNRGQIVGRYVVSNPGDSVNPFLSHGFIATPKRSLKLVANR